MKTIPNKSVLIQHLEVKHNEKIEELLRRMYVDDHLPTKQIAEELHLSYATTWKYLQLSGIYSRRLRIL